MGRGLFKKLALSLVLIISPSTYMYIYMGIYKIAYIIDYIIYSI